MPIKPTEHEDEYFARIEQEMKKKIEEQKKKRTSEEEREKLRELHFMKCPKCGMDLIEIDFRGMKMDECEYGLTQLNLMQWLKWINLSLKGFLTCSRNRRPGLVVYLCLFPP
jgi:hypothetical protein